MSEIVARAEQAVLDADEACETLEDLERIKIAWPAYIRVNKCERCLQVPCRGHWVHVYGEVGP